jgi:hypothetical protein
VKYWSKSAETVGDHLLSLDRRAAVTYETIGVPVE